MRVHQVEVDDEVFLFVKARAEPLEDTFNSALRRLLPLEGRDKKPLATVAASAMLTFPTGTPEALRQILEVVRLVRGRAYTRTAATQFVAKQHGVFPQTVLDKYCRQLQLSATEFDQLLEQNDLVRLREILRSKFPAQAEIIEHTLPARSGGR